MKRPLLPLIALTLGWLPVTAQTKLTVVLINTAGVRTEMRETMKTETSRIFLAAGIELEWLECEESVVGFNLAECSKPLGPARFMLELAAGTNKRNPKSLGMAMLQTGTGTYACLYPELVMELARDAGWESGDLLGHAAAHELGHLLLGSSGHSAGGIMRARWEARDLRGLSHAGLVFLPGQLASVISRLSKPPGTPALHAHGPSHHAYVP